MEDAGAALDGSGDGGEVEDVGGEDGDAAGAGAGEREEVGGVRAGEDGGVDCGVALFEEGLHQPRSDEAVGSGDANRRLLIILRWVCHFPM